jgi:hypothetical protein
MTAALTIGPALANGEEVRIGPFVIITCTSSSPCQTYKNNGYGAGLKGLTANGTGLQGVATSAGNGVVGQAKANTGVEGIADGGSGVYGQSNSGFGVSGQSTSSYGVTGFSNNNYGMLGISNSSAGVYGYSTGQDGVLAVSDAYYALEAHSKQNDAVHAFNENTGTAVAALATNGSALYAQTVTGLGAYVSTSSGNGADVTGTYIGLTGRAPAGTGQFPLDLTDSTGNNLFFVNGNGDVFYHGTLNGFLKTPRGIVTAYVPQDTSPTVEYTGSGQLISGSAFVRLDQTFAMTIDLNTAYHVVLTPDGDTRGLYVASKNPSGFLVREVQGGRGTLSFDYHIYAPAFDRDRISVMPHAPLTRRRPGPPSRALPPVVVPHR